MDPLMFATCVVLALVGWGFAGFWGALALPILFIIVGSIIYAGRN